MYRDSYTYYIRLDTEIWHHIHSLRRFDTPISYIIYHTSYIIHHTSYIIPSHIIHHTSYIIHHTHTSYIIHHTSHITHLSVQCLTRNMLKQRFVLLTLMEHLKQTVPPLRTWITHPHAYTHTHKYHRPHTLTHARSSMPYQHLLCLCLNPTLHTHHTPLRPVFDAQYA